MDSIRNSFRHAKPQRLLAERGGALDETAGDATEQVLVAVEARKALMSRSVARTVTASNSAVMNLSGALTMRAGDDIVVTAGGAAVMIAGGDLHMEGGASGMIAAKEAHVESGFVGMLLAGRASMGEQTRVLITTRQVVLIGVLIGALYPLTRYLLRRFVLQAEPRREAQRDTPVAARFGRRLLGCAIRIAIVALVGGLIFRWARKQAEPVLPVFAGS